MKKIIILTIGSLIILISCKKEKFPDTDELSGTWTEQTDNLFKHKLVFAEETLYFVKSNTSDTLLYRLDKKKGLIYLTQINNSSLESNHKILLNKKSNILEIWGLVPSIPENESETKFEKIN